MRALVVDDEYTAREYLVELLRATDRVDPVAAVATAAEATAVLDQDLGIEVAFVDIRLIDRAGDTSGLVWAKAMVERPSPPLLVLATAMPDHALDAFEAGAVDYLLKPFTRARVTTCVERLQGRRAHTGRPPTRMVARDRNGLVFLTVSGVLAFEASERLTFVHHVEGRFLADASLSQLERQFAGLVIRAHRNWIVALEHVRRLDRGGGEPSLRVGTDLVVPVSRERAAAVRDALVGPALGTRR